MKIRRTKIPAFSATIAAILFGNAASAQSWFDSSYTAFVQITSTNFHAATQLRKVNLVCPKAGYILAQATTQLSIWPTAGGSAYVTAGFSIAVNDAPPTEMHSGSAHYFSATTEGASESIATQRVAVCAAGQNMDIYFMGYRGDTDTSASANNPNLVVQFFDTRI